MKHAFAIGALLAAWYPLSAQMQPPQQSQPGMPPGSTMGNPGAIPNSGNTRGIDSNMGGRSDAIPTRIDDKAFLKRAAIDDQMQIEMGKLAAQKGSSEDVKQFGRKVAAEQQKANQELQQLAAKENVPVENTLDAKHKAKVDKLAKLDGAGFDKAFLKEQSRNSRDELAEFQAEAQRGGDANVKSFATRVVPMLEAHTQVVKDLQSGKSTSSADRQK